MFPKLLFLATAALAAPATAHADACDPPDDGGTTFTLRYDNDVFGGTHSDQGYSGGGMGMVASPSVLAAGGAECMPTGLGWLDRGSDWLGRGDARNVTFALSQGIYTPGDRYNEALDPDDRPYAGLAYATLGRNVRRGDRLATTQLKLGIVGPSSRAMELQNAIHHVIGRPRFRGWDHQLPDEPVFAVVHERAWRWTGPQLADGYGWDFGTHAGASLGNLATHLNGGADVRFGRHLPDDFGGSPLRPGGENSAPALRPRARDWVWHLYASLDTRVVGHDVTLDGTTWKDSHSVDTRGFVADLTLGAVATHGPWRFAATHTRRTREFDGQDEAPVFGGFALSRSF